MDKRTRWVAILAAGALVPGLIAQQQQQQQQQRRGGEAQAEVRIADDEQDQQSQQRQQQQRQLQQEQQRQQPQRPGILPGQQQQQQDQQARGARGQQPLPDANRASKLVGMAVKNQQNENLGEIQDLVVDLENGKVSYAVLSVGGFLGIGEKFIAVPPAAFDFDQTDNKLVLRVNKQQVEQAPGFSRNEWPDVNNPAWGAAADWVDQSRIRGEVQIGDRETQFRTGTEQQQNEAQNALRQRQEELRRRQQQQPDQQPRLQGQPGQQQQGIEGSIERIDPENGRLTIRTDLGTQVIMVDRNALIELEGIPNAKLQDLKEGDRVRVNTRGGERAVSIRKVE